MTYITSIIDYIASIILQSKNMPDHTSSPTANSMSVCDHAPSKAYSTLWNKNDYNYKKGWLLCILKSFATAVTRSTQHNYTYKYVHAQGVSSMQEHTAEIHP